MAERENADRIALLEQHLSSLWRYLGKQDEAITARRNADRTGQEIETYRREIEKQLVHITEASARYNSVITLIGYASYFATWSFVRTDMKPRETAIVGLLGLVSVALYVVWEIGMMLQRFISARRLADLINRELQPDEFLSRLEKVKQKEAVGTARLLWLWGIVFFASVLTAAAGGSVLMWSLARTILPS